MNNFIAIIAECFIVIRLCNRTLGFKHEKWTLLKSFLFLITVFFVLTINAMIFDDDSAVWTAAAVLSLICFIYSAVFLKGKVHEKLLISIVPMFVLYPINFLVSGIFEGFKEPFYRSGLPSALFGALTFFFVCELIVRTKRRRAYSLSSFQLGIQAACYLITFLIAGLVWNYSHDAPERFIWVYIMIAILNVLLYIMMSKMQRDSVINEEYRLSKINLAAQEKFVIEARERYSEMRTLRHDMKHYFTTAAELLSDGKYEEAKDYIERVLDEKIIPSAVGVSTGSAVVDAVINNKISICAKNGIEMKCTIDTVLFGGNDIDISILLSNLLDNAISGCNEEKPILELIIGTKKSLTYIVVKNSIAESVLEENPELKTNDADDSSHGFGIGSVRRIVEKHGGSVEFKEEDNLFIAEVWLEN